MSSIDINELGQVIVPDKSLARGGKGAASQMTQQLIRDHVKPYNDLYNVESMLGKGNFGVVNLVRHRDSNAMRAMKHIDLRKLKVQGAATVTVYLMMREIEIMKKLDHPNVIKVFDIFRGTDDLHIVMELCGGGELEEALHAQTALDAPNPFPPKVPRYTADVARKLVRQMLAGVHYLHLNGVVHRDLKLENFVFSGPGKGEGTLKLIDFGFARSNIDNNDMTMNCGSLVYKASA